MSLPGAGDEDFGVRTDCADCLGGFPILLIGVEIGLVDENDGTGSATCDQGEVSLHTAKVEVGPSVCDDADEVDIGRDDLLLAGLSRSLSRETGLAGKPSPDNGIEVARADLEGNPVTYGGEFGVAGSIMIDLSSHDDFVLVSILEEGAIGDLVVTNQARGYPTSLLVGSEGLGMFGIPAQLDESHTEV